MRRSPSHNLTNLHCQIWGLMFTEFRGRSVNSSVVFECTSGFFQSTHRHCNTKYTWAKWSPLSSTAFSGLVLDFLRLCSPTGLQLQAEGVLKTTKMKAINYEGMQWDQILSSTSPDGSFIKVLSSYFCIKMNQTLSLDTWLCVCGVNNRWRVDFVCVIVYWVLSFNQEACFIRINIHSIYFTWHTVHIILFIQPCPLCI